MNWVNLILSHLISGGVAVGLALWLAKLVLDKWISNKFGEELERFRHLQSIELERTKSQISTLVGRTTRIHQLEFEVIPLIWEKMLTADKNLRNGFSLMKYYADVKTLNPLKLEVFIEKSKFEDWEKESIREANNKERQYRKVVDFREIYTSIDAFNEFDSYRRTKGIFVPSELREKLSEVITVMQVALAEHMDEVESKYEEGERTRRDRSQRKRYVADMPVLIDEVERLILQRLWETGLEDVRTLHSSSIA